jgi:hypothetical protein
MRTKKAVTHTVSFRLDEHLFGLLAEQATKKGMSPGDLARDFLRESLTDPPAQQTLERMTQLETQLAKLHSRVAALHQSMRHATYTLLCQRGGSEEDAEEFVSKYMADQYG